MAIIYYPKNQFLYRKDTVSGSYETLAIATNPNTIIYFDTASSINAISASTLDINVTHALTASYSPPSGRSIVLCTAYTPTITGADAAEIPIPYSPVDGVTSLLWSIKRLNFRTKTSGNVSSSISIEKSIGNGVFSPNEVGRLILPENSYESFTGSIYTINSGDKIRFNVIELGTSQNWTLTVEITPM
jgi:hypothetical protein